MLGSVLSPLSMGEFISEDSTCRGPASLHLERLQQRRLALQRLGSRRHTCHQLEHACFGRKQVVADVLRPTLLRMKIRGVHVGHTLQAVSETGLLRARRHNHSSSSSQRHSYSPCVPLLWWPVWGYNIGEFFQTSVAGVAELVDAGVVERSSILLAPEVGGWPLQSYHYGMLKAFSTHPIRTVRQLGRGAADAGGSPRCFERALVCRFRDVYEPQTPLRPWSAARAIVASMRKPPRSLLSARASGPQAAEPFTVLFASRLAAKNGARLLLNELQLIELCRRWVAPPACNAARAAMLAATTRCEPWVFGKRGFHKDVAVVQEADVLVGTHGAALVHALFMRRGGALLEVRPYGFRGSWPDRYHLAMARQENATHAFILQTTDPALCEPVPAANVSAWDARPLNTRVRPAVFERALAAAACARGAASAARSPSGAAPSPAAASPFLYSALNSVVIENA